MMTNFDKLIEIANINPDTSVGWVSVYSNMRNILETTIKDNIGKDKYDALPTDSKLCTGVQNFCYNLKIDKKNENYLHCFRRRANAFIHSNREANGEYFTTDLKTLCNAISKASKTDIPEELKKKIENKQFDKSKNTKEKTVEQPIQTTKEKETPRFDKFTKFGTVADEETRKEIAENIYTNLTEIGTPLETENKETDLYSDAVNSILDNDTIYELTNENPELSEKITSDILDFVNKTKKLVNKTANPIAKEAEQWLEFQNLDENTFNHEWENIEKYLSKIYDKDVVDTDFYKKEFEKSLDDKNKHKPQFESIKEHLSDKWRELIEKKQLDWELEIIDSERKKFCKELYRKIEELKKLQEILSPFINELGRLWDMSGGRWQNTNFDILKRYAELMQRDKSLQELAEMLGRMQQAEQEYEEEIFTDIQLKTKWKTENASKSDIVGVHESDDISSLLPSETALLANPTTELIFYKKFAEKKLQTFDYQSRILTYEEEEFENKRLKAKEDKKGPFIICVDTSGSMRGTPETVAKTLCFAILKIAIRDNRKCYLISFSTGIQTLNLTDLKNSLDKIIDFLSMSFHGGTDAAPAMHEALRMLETEDYKKADIIMVSDFVMSGFGEAMQKKIANAKESKTKFHSLVIGSSQNQQVINEFDNNWIYDVNSPNRVLGLVKNVREV